MVQGFQYSSHTFYKISDLSEPSMNSFSSVFYQFRNVSAKGAFVKGNRSMQDQLHANVSFLVLVQFLGPGWLTDVMPFPVKNGLQLFTCEWFPHFKAFACFHACSPCTVGGFLCICMLGQFCCIQEVHTGSKVLLYLLWLKTRYRIKSLPQKFRYTQIQ